MSNLKTVLVLSGALYALSGCAPELPSELPPKLTDVPVEQESRDWWRPRHDEKIEQAKDARIDLVFIGDSITHGWENRGAEVWQEFYQDRNAFNLGFSGDRTEHVLWRLQNGAIAGMAPKLAILMIGTNNTGQRMDPAVYTAEGIERIVSQLRERMPDTRVLILGIFPRHMSPHNEMRKRNDEINRLI